MERPEPEVRRSHRRRPRRRADHRGRGLHLVSVAGGRGLRPGRESRRADRRRTGPRLVFADGTQSIYPGRSVGRWPDRPRAHPQRRGLLLAQPRLRPLRRQGHDGQRAVVRRTRTSSTSAASAWPTSTARAPPTSSTCSRDGVRLYFNQSGNGWSEPQRTARLSRASTTSSSVAAVDLLGNGTACLVWSSPLPGDARRPMRYVDLMGGQKPHLLVKTDQQPRRRDACSTTRRRPSSTCRTSATASRGSPGCRSRCTWSSASRPTTTSAATASSPATPTTTATSTASSASSAASAWSSSGTPRSSPRSARAARCPTGDQHRRSLARAAGAHQDLVPHRRLSRPRPRLRLLRRAARMPTDQGEYYREPGLTDAQARAASARRHGAARRA